MKNRTEAEIATLRQINDTSALPNSLPYELVAEIFKLACPPIDFSKRMLCERDDEEYVSNIPAVEIVSGTINMREMHDLSNRYVPLTLCAVCHRWREVALSSEGLWSTFALKVLDWKLKIQIPLLRFYLTNTGTLPFSLDLDMRVQQNLYVEDHLTQTPIIEWKELQPLANVIFQEFPKKIQTLRVAGAPPAWMCFLSQKRLPRLCDLTFAWNEEIGLPTTATIEGGAFYAEPYSGLQSSPGLPPLTVLHLRNVYTEICAKMLLLCPHLVEYQCYAPTRPPMYLVADPPLNLSHLTRRPVTLKEPFTLPNLKRFGWASHEGDEIDVWNTALLENIRLPNLEELHWGGCPGTRLSAEEGDVIFRFFDNLPKTLRSFAFYNYDLSFLRGLGEDYSLLLSHFPHLRSLVFHECSSSFMILVFHLLSPHTPAMGSKILLPALDKIAVRNYRNNRWDEDDMDEDSMGKALIRMLEERRVLLGISQFTFEAADCVVKWSRGTQDGRERELIDKFSVTTEGPIGLYSPDGKLTALCQ